MKAPQPAPPSGGLSLREGLFTAFLALAVPLLVAAYPLLQDILGLDAGYQGWRESFTVYFLSITLEATPFILLGALFSGLLEMWLSPDVLPRWTARTGWWGIPLTALLSPLFPVCECGVVMVMRGLIRKGLPLPHAVTYLLAAPILNPTVLASTGIAFQDLAHPLARGLGGLAVAVAAGSVFALLDEGRLVKPEPGITSRGPLPGGMIGLPMAPAPSTEAACGCGHDHAPFRPGLLGRWVGISQRVSGDFIEMLPYFLIGVSIASAMKTFIPPGDLASLGQGPVSGPLTMMATAFVLSLCAESDAFVAASFTEFSFPAVMSFLILGPMLDIKLLMMYRPIFTWRAVALLALLTVLGVAGVTLFLAVL